MIAYTATMPFSIRDDEIRDLADELQKLTGAKNRSAAMKQALQAQIKIAKQSKPLHQRVSSLQRRAARLHESGTRGS